MKMRITIDVEFDAQAYANLYDPGYMDATPEKMAFEMEAQLMHALRVRFEPSDYTFNAHVIDNGAGFNDPTGLFDGHIDGGMHDGCPCKACAFCRTSGAGE